jgi:hypothetical protein
VQNPLTGVHKYSASDPARASLFDALFDILAEVHYVGSLLPSVPFGRLLLAADQLHKSPSPATAADVVAALGHLAPHLEPVTNARLLDLSVKVAIATDRMQPFQRLAVEGVLGQN